jgi:hypothetical protein
LQTTMYHSFHRDLGNGLVLRWSTVEDTERLVTLMSQIFRRKADDPPNIQLGTFIRALMNGDHPLMGSHDFGVIEDTSKADKPIVASTCLWKHTWTYEGIPFGVGRPEMVATDPAYRHQGLVRALFEMIHAQSEADGDLIQTITGIYYFYRQFGYEYALELGDPHVTPVALLPQAKEGEPELFTLREATVRDIPDIEAFYQQRMRGSMVAETLTNPQWLYEIETWKKHPELAHASNIQMIIDAAGQTVGCVATNAYRSSESMTVWLLELAAGVDMQRALPSLLRALHTAGLRLKPVRPNLPALQKIALAVGTTHPIHDILSGELDQTRGLPYAWYIRVKDLPAFLTHIAPALEQRLAVSPVAGHTGDIKLDFYRSGLRLVFEQGHLKGVEEWKRPLYGDAEGAGFPPLVFLQVLFGYRSIDALRQVFPDVWVTDEARPILKILFPTRPSTVIDWY